MPAFGSSLPARMAESAGTIVYVDISGNDTTGDGSSGNPWRTVQKGIDNVSDGGIVEARTGNYDEQLTISGRNQTNPTTIRAASGANVRTANVFMTGTSGNWRIRGLEFDGSLAGVTRGAAVHIGQGGVPDAISNIEIDQCNVHDSSYTGLGNPEGLYANPGGTGIQIWNSVFHHNGRRILTQAPVTLTGSGQSLQVDSIFIATDYPPPADLWLPDKSKLHYTGTLTGPNRLTGCTGIGSWPAGTKLYEVAGNEPAKADHGTYSNLNAGTGNPDTLFANCIAYDNEGYGMQVWSQGGPQITWLVNCTCCFNFNGAGFVMSANASNLSIKCKQVNCIAYKNAPNAIGNTGYGFDTFFGGANTAGNQNTLDSCIANQNGDGSANFAADIANTFIKTNTSTSDPLFTDPGARNFHLSAGSPAIGFGDPNYTPATDFYGVARVTPDIGAVAFASASLLVPSMGRRW